MRGTCDPRRTLAILVLTLTFSGLAGCSGSQDQAATGPPRQVLARVDLAGDLKDLHLPVYAELEDGQGVDYALVVATPAELQASGAPCRVLDAYVPGRGYLYGSAEYPGANAEATRVAPVLYDDGENVLVRFDPDVDEALADLGFEMVLLDDEPMVLTAGPVPKKTVLSGVRPLIAADPTVQQMVDAVSQDNLRTSLLRLSGREAVTVEGEPRTFTTRNTQSSQASFVTRYLRDVVDGLAANGVTSAFQDWDETEQYTRNGVTLSYSCQGRNVVAEIAGQSLPGEVVVLIAHADSICDAAGNNYEAAAPGADDDASGCAALLEAARVMSGQKFQRTVRFVFTMGEEQGIFGGKAYARKVYQESQAPGGASIKAVLNLDMIAYSTAATLPATCRVKTRSRTTNLDGYNADAVIANTFTEAVAAYGLNGAINPVLTDDGDNSGDQVRFWARGFPAAWAIQDDRGDWNKSYHKPGDNLENTNLPYCTAIVKATVATAAHLAELRPKD